MPTVLQVELISTCICRQLSAYSNTSGKIYPIQLARYTIYSWQDIPYTAGNGHVSSNEQYFLDICYWVFNPMAFDLYFPKRNISVKAWIPVKMFSVNGNDIDTLTLTLTIWPIMFSAKSYFYLMLIHLHVLIPSYHNETKFVNKKESELVATIPKNTINITMHWD